MTEQKLFKQANRGRKAKAKLDDELFVEALNTLEADYIHAWKRAADTEARETCWHALRALDKFREHLATVIADGRLAQAELDRMTKAA